MSPSRDLIRAFDPWQIWTGQPGERWLQICAMIEPYLAFQSFVAGFPVLMLHLGSATLETRNAMGFRALENLEAFFAGKTPRDLLRP